MAEAPIAAIELHHIKLSTRREHKWTGLTEPIGGYVLVKMTDELGAEGWGEAPALKILWREPGNDRRGRYATSRAGGHRVPTRLLQRTADPRGDGAVCKRWLPGWDDSFGYDCAPQSSLPAVACCFDDDGRCGTGPPWNAKPPTSRYDPLICSASSERRKAQARAMSSGRLWRPLTVLAEACAKPEV
jgi:hypothetical protein